MPFDGVLTVGFESGYGNGLDAVGGKGMSLAKLLAAGAPVPPGFTVTRRRSAKRLARSGSRGWLDNWPGSMRRPRPIWRRAPWRSAKKSVHNLCLLV